MKNCSLQHYQKMGEEDGWALREPKDHFLSPKAHETYNQAYKKAKKKEQKGIELCLKNAHGLNKKDN